MRTSSLCLLSLCLGAALAHAETERSVWTRGDTRLRARPGETAPVVGRADQGEALVVVGEQGRWLRVEKGRHVGWVTRSQVDDRRVAAPRKRDRRGGFSGKPRQDALRVKVAIDRVRGFDDPVRKASCVLDLERGDVVTVLGRGPGGWILVEPDDGTVGWIPAAAVTDAGRFARDPRGPSVAEPAVAPRARPDATPAPAGRVAVGVMATAGATSFAMEQVGAQQGFATASGPAAALAAGAQVRLGGGLAVGAGADASLGASDLVYYGAEVSAPMASKATTVDARAELAWGRSWQLALRAGYHFGSLAIASERAEPMLLGEQVAGVTAGLGGALPVGRRVVLAGAIDVMPAGVQRPAELPPGVLYATGVRAAWARASVAVRLPARLVGALAYRGGLTSAELTDGAATPAVATRTDESHTVTAGLGLAW